LAWKEYQTHFTANNSLDTNRQESQSQHHKDPTPDPLASKPAASKEKEDAKDAISKEQHLTIKRVLADGSREEFSEPPPGSTIHSTLIIIKWTLLGGYFFLEMLNLVSPLLHFSSLVLPF
jgi:hypothetical protein